LCGEGCVVKADRCVDFFAIFHFCHHLFATILEAVIPKLGENLTLTLEAPFVTIFPKRIEGLHGRKRLEYKRGSTPM
jgi:hypothetical protein